MAKQMKPSIIFIDEIDSLCGQRSEGGNEHSNQVKTEFLVQMEGVGKDDTGVLVLGATNIPWDIDQAMRRRFQKRIYIPLPSAEARIYLLKNLMKQNKHTLTEKDFTYIGERLGGFSGADLLILAIDACYQPMRKAQAAEYFK